MEQMTLSEVCKKYNFTRRVIQGYEKEGLIKHIGKNKYGYLLYDDVQIRKIAYIRYLQLNGLTLKEISSLVKSDSMISISILQDSNNRHRKQIDEISNLIEKNNIIMSICTKESNYKKRENMIYELIMEELKHD